MNREQFDISGIDLPGDDYDANQQESQENI